MHPLPGGRAVTRDLLTRLLTAWLAVAAAVSAVVTVAALADGHLPRVATLRVTALPLAAFLGAAWTVAGWRSEGADVALASVGCRPTRVLAPVAVVASGLLLLGGDAQVEATPAWDLTLTPRAVTVSTPDGPHHYTWGAEGARRVADGATFPALPAPGVSTAGPGGHEGGHPLLAALARCALLLGLIAFLAAREVPPRLALTVASAGAAFVAGHAMGAWLA